MRTCIVKKFACVQQFKQGLGMQSKCHEEMSNKSKWFLNARCNWTQIVTVTLHF